MPKAPDPVLVEKRGSCVTRTLNRPETLHALSRKVQSYLMAAISIAANKASCRDSCTGLDLRARDPKNSTVLPDVEASVSGTCKPLVTQILDIPKPMVRAVNGTAAGAGVAFASACDIEIAALRPCPCSARPRAGVKRKLDDDPPSSRSARRFSRVRTGTDKK